MNNSNYAKLVIGAGALLDVAAVVLAYRDGGFSATHFALFIISALLMMGAVLLLKRQTNN